MFTKLSPLHMQCKKKEEDITVSMRPSKATSKKVGSLHRGHFGARLKSYNLPVTVACNIQME